jgi:rare lipoprotein A
MASRYHHELAGGRTASGESYHPDSLTAAHRTLPLGTWVRVTNEGNGRSVVVRINDRGPFRPRSRVLDLSARAADELSVTGVARVSIAVVDSAEVVARALLARLDTLLAGQARTPALTPLAPVLPIARSPLGLDGWKAARFPRRD